LTFAKSSISSANSKQFGISEAIDGCFIFTSKTPYTYSVI